MGWFNNSMTAGRVNNSVQMLAVAVSMSAAKDQLDNVNTFVEAQRQRAQGLAGQAFAVQGASSSLGRELQSSINELGSCLASGRELSGEIDESITALNFLISQFDVPRLARNLNMSGRDLTALATGGAIETRQNLDAMKNRYTGPVVNAIITIDHADHVLNGSRSIVARDSLPQLD